MEITNLPSKTRLSLEHLGKKEIAELADNVLSLMNLSGVDTGRATHYESNEELEVARTSLHSKTFEMDRTVYGCLMCFPGITDFTRQKAISVLLGNPWNSGRKFILNQEQERQIIDFLVSELKPNQMLNLFIDLKLNRTMNARTRKTIIPFILNSNKLEWWAVKYKQKLKESLTHAWNIRPTSVISAILRKKRRTTNEEIYLKKYIGNFITDPKREKFVYECISFILGNKVEYSLSLLKKYEDAKIDFNEARGLPKETIFGLWNTYHKSSYTKDQVLKLSQSSMTSKEKVLVQKTAKKAGVKIDFDPLSQDMVSLYKYAFEMGMTNDIRDAIEKKAERAAGALPFKFEHVGIVLDDSFSMYGSDEQKLHPYAVALATRAMLSKTAPKITLKTISGSDTVNMPTGGSAIGRTYLKVAEEFPEAIFVISDGFENQPAGRFAEVINLMKKIDMSIPTYHVNPVAAASSVTGSKKLHPGIPVMPVIKPESMGLSLFKTMLETDPERGLTTLVNMSIPVFQKSRKLGYRKEVTSNG